MSYFQMVKQGKIERGFIRVKRINDGFIILRILIFMTGYLIVPNLHKALQFFLIRPGLPGANPLLIRLTRINPRSIF